MTETTIKILEILAERPDLEMPVLMLALEQAKAAGVQVEVAPQFLQS